ncbi:unnamed protein product [Caretta caretta]
MYVDNTSGRITVIIVKAASTAPENLPQARCSNASCHQRAGRKRRDFTERSGTQTGSSGEVFFKCKNRTARGSPELSPSSPCRALQPPSPCLPGLRLTPLNIVNDRGLRDIIQITSSNRSDTFPSRGSIASQINYLYDNEKTTKLEGLKNALAVALTGDHWTSLNNHSDLGVTAHLY